jgi:hypothetical protein
MASAKRSPICPPPAMTMLVGFVERRISLITARMSFLAAMKNTSSSASITVSPLG